jgi:hypothetical protein
MATTTGKDNNDGKEDYNKDVGGYRWRGSQTTINQKWQRKKWRRGRRQRARTAMTTGKDDDDGKEDESEDDGKDDRRGQ